MVSLQAALSPRVRTAGSSSGAFVSSPPAEFSEPSKKRKRDEGGGLWEEEAESLSPSAGNRNVGTKQVAAGGGGSFLELLMRCKSRRLVVEKDKRDQEETSRVAHQLLDVELHLGDRPVATVGQRFLDAQSGSTHFVNSRTNSTWTWKDQRWSPPSPQKPLDFDCPSPAGIDLELNLSCDSSSSAGSQREGDLSDCQHRAKKKSKITSPTNRSTAPRVAEVAAPAPTELDQSSPEEMVAAVCARCHMLIMMRRSSPSCPNCKYLHPPPPEQQQLHGGRSMVRPTTGFSQLLCCKD